MKNIRPSVVREQRIISAVAWSFARQINGKTVEQNYSMPYMGYPYYSRQDDLIHNDYHNDDCMPMRGLYRWHILDRSASRKNSK